MLDGKRIVIAGVTDDHSLAYPIADLALRAGAFVTLAAAPEHFARCRERVEWLPRGAHAMRVDVHVAGDLRRMREHLRCGYGSVDAAVHLGHDADTLALFAEALAPLLTDDSVLVGLGLGDASPQGSRAAAAVRRRYVSLTVGQPAAGRDDLALAQEVCRLLDRRVESGAVRRGAPGPATYSFSAAASP